MAEIILTAVFAGSYIVKDACSRVKKIMLEDLEGFVTISGQFSSNYSVYDNYLCLNDELSQPSEITERIVSFCDSVKMEPYVKSVNYNRLKLLYAGSVHTGEILNEIESFQKLLYEPVNDDSLRTETVAEIIRNYLKADNRLFIIGDQFLNQQLYASEYLGLNYYKNTTLEQNRYFSQEELKEGAFVCMVPAGLMNENYLPYVTGDSITLVDFYMRGDQCVHVETYEFKVIGTFSNKGEGKEAALYHNSVYIPMSTLQFISEQQQELMKNYDCEVSVNSEVEQEPWHLCKLELINEPVITVKDPEILEKLAVSITDSLDLPDIRVDTSYGDYKKLVQPIAAMDLISGFLIAVSLVSELLIAGLLTINEIKNSKKEIGLSLALGMTRFKAYVPMFVRQCGCSVAALGAALAVTKIISGKIAVIIVQRYRAQGTYIDNVFYNLRVNEVVKNTRIALSWENVLVIAVTILVTKIIILIGAHFYTRKISPKTLLRG